MNPDELLSDLTSTRDRRPIDREFNGQEAYLALRQIEGDNAPAPTKCLGRIAIDDNCHSATRIRSNSLIDGRRAA